MFNKILIANRGEIACRVIKTARKMGLQTVAVYSEADREALHVSLADEAICIGSPAAADSYLSIEKIVDACSQSGAQAVHPGYGFLSENAAFAERIAAAGVTFIGPSAEAIRKMGDKAAAKKLAQQAGVNTIPGHPDVIETADAAAAAAQLIGYPVMLKAAAGGGGKGMRVAHDEAQCRDGFVRATNEARSAFGDGRILLEKFIEEPRHIEIQLLADRHGNLIHLGERECSLQRRHQKVIEEAPSPLLDAATRTAMGEQAIALAAAVQYESAGTVEFLLDSKRNFYFLEMNTRLQVEHPVTEFVTGVDLVEMMIRIAAGEPLPMAQADVVLKGWAIESRIYAESPSRGFLPSVGRIERFVPPAQSAVVRLDSGICEGSEVSIHYDPLIAKLITHGPTRDDAIANMRESLNAVHVRGVAHNIAFLGALIGHPRFIEGRLSTNLIAEVYPDGFQPRDVFHPDPAVLIVVASAVHRQYMDRAAGISGQLAGYERRVEDQWVAVLHGEQHPVEVRPVDGGHDIVYGQQRYEIRSEWQFGQPLFQGRLNGDRICVQIERGNIDYRLTHWGAEVDVMVLTTRAAELLNCMPINAPNESSCLLRSPMPGLLTQLLVAEGNEIGAGQDLAVIEAMKMENVLRADRDGRVEELLAAVGDTLAVDQPIMRFQA